MKKILISICCLFCINSYANELFKNADLAVGKALVEKNCVSCHASSYGGDGSEIYKRPFRKVESSQGLINQVRACNTNLNQKWFDDEELDASAYLNKMYYKFEE